jgi:hypothetical protein
MRDPHRHHRDGTNKAELDGNVQYLILRIYPGDCFKAGLANGRVAELFADRTGPMADDRRGPYEGNGGFKR